MTQAGAFDDLAFDYDASFTDTLLGQRLRAATWRRFDAEWGPGDAVLELNCGTGADAVHLAERGVRVTATDASAPMVRATRRRAERTGVDQLVDPRHLSIEALDQLDGPFDGVISNFGGLNCVADLAAVAAQLGRLVRPGGVAVLGIMGPIVPWEWAWYLARAKPGTALRRLRPGGAPWRGLTIRYPTPAGIRRRFAPWFEVEATAGVGVLLPPTFADAWASRHPRLIDRLDRIERRIDGAPGAAWLADHHLTQLRRTADHGVPR